MMSLTAPKGAGDALLGAQPVRATPADSVATRVLVKGEPMEAPAGRADDFVWPRRDVVTATGVLPPDPVEPPTPGRATTAPAATGIAAAPEAERAAPAPRGPAAADDRWRLGLVRAAAALRDAAAEQRGFFGGWFGGGRW